MDQARQFLTQFTGAQAYGFFYLLLAATGCGFPFNSDITLITAGILAALGYFNLYILILVAWAAILTGDSINFFVARTYGKKLLTKKPFSFILKPEKITAAERYFNEKGSKFLFVVRFLPLIRTPLFFSAGSLQIKPKTFYFYNGIATFIYVPLLCGSAYYAGENIDFLLAEFKRVQFALLGLAAVALIFFVLKRKMKRPVTS